jgi:O-acetyl-ADP-ribose deacetylase (regulator of RNase III)
VKGRITLAEGDIAQADVDALVNAANTALVLGSGVAGAIRERGGPEIQRECDALAPIAAVTGAGRLPARCVIHAAGMQPGGSASEQSVASAVRRSLELAAERGCRSVAVPAVGAGVGGLSLQRCAELLLAEARAFLARETCVLEVRFVLFGEPAYRVFEAALDAAKVREQMERLRARRP